MKRIQRSSKMGIWGERTYELTAGKPIFLHSVTLKKDHQGKLVRQRKTPPTRYDKLFTAQCYPAGLLTLDHPVNRSLLGCSGACLCFNRLVFGSAVHDS